MALVVAVAQFDSDVFPCRIVLGKFLAPVAHVMTSESGDGKYKLSSRMKFEVGESAFGTSAEDKAETQTSP